jgi:hypothetical protein
MKLRSILAAGVYASLIPLIGATGTWTEPMAAAPFADLEAPALVDTASSPAQAAPAPALPVRAARIERRDAASGLSSSVDAIARTNAGRVWLAWTSPAQKRPGSYGSWNRGVAQCVLDDEGNFSEGGNIDDGTETLVILARVSNRAIDRVAVTDARCTVDAGARTVYWLDRVVPRESVGVLAGLVRREASERSSRDGDRDEPDRSHGRRHALVALALTADPSADAALEEFVAPTNPPWLRRDAAFWLGAARAARGAVVIDRLARGDKDDDFREHLTFVLTLTGNSGLEALLDLARNDASSKVRGQALFWLGQKAGERAVRTLRRAVDDDPDRDVRKRAVFAISQLPNDQSVPKLIELARSHRDPEVRKQAMFWLGQTGDARAVEFFEAVLKQ